MGLSLLYCWMLLDALNEYTYTYPSHWKSVVNWVPVYSIYWHFILLCPIIYVCANSTICHSSIFHISQVSWMIAGLQPIPVNWSRRPHSIPSPESKQGLLRQSVNIRGHSLLYESSGFKVVQFQGNGIASEYDDVIKWKHFPRYWPFARGIHRSPNSPQRPVTRNFDDFFDQRLNKRLRKQSWGWFLRRHRAHYDVTVMIYLKPKFVAMTTLSSPATVQVSVVTTYGVTGDDKVSIMTTLRFRC